MLKILLGGNLRSSINFSYRLKKVSNFSLSNPLPKEVPVGRRKEIFGVFLKMTSTNLYQRFHFYLKIYGRHCFSSSFDRLNSQIVDLLSRSCIFYYLFHRYFVPHLAFSLRNVVPWSHCLKKKKKYLKPAKSC